MSGEAPTSPGAAPTSPGAATVCSSTSWALPRAEEDPLRAASVSYSFNDSITSLAKEAGKLHGGPANFVRFVLHDESEARHINT